METDRKKEILYKPHSLENEIFLQGLTGWVWLGRKGRMAGMYCGEGAVAYAYKLLYEITGEFSYRRYVGIHAKIMCRYISRNRHLDLTYGNARAVLVLCRQSRDTGDEAYLKGAQNALSYLEDRRLESGQGVTRLEKAEGSPVCSLACFRTETVLPVANLLT